MDAINSLQEIQEDCSQNGWDGYKGNFFLNYAGYFGPNNKIHGMEPFINSIPRTILEKISSYFSKSQ
jgi:hypothetical protein